MKIINLTPHELTIVNDNQTLIIPPSGKVARVDMFRTLIEKRPVTVAGVHTQVDIFVTRYSEVMDLPEPVFGVIYVVSSQVLSRCGDREDVFAPSDLVRDAKGNDIGCKGLTM